MGNYETKTARMAPTSILMNIVPNPLLVSTLGVLGVTAITSNAIAVRNIGLICVLRSDLTTGPPIIALMPHNQ